MFIRNFANFTGKHLFSCKFCKISKSSFFHRPPLVAASVNMTPKCYVNTIDISNKMLLY